GVFARFDLLFEESLQVPLVIAAPGLPKPGAPTRALVDVTDVYPTLLELAGAAPLPLTEGQSLGPILRDPAATTRTVVTSVPRRARTALRSRLRAGAELPPQPHVPALRLEAGADGHLGQHAPAAPGRHGRARGPFFRERLFHGLDRQNLGNALRQVLQVGPLG